MALMQKIRMVAAIVLLGAIFLPLSQCSQHGANSSPPTSQALAHSHHLFPRSDNDFEYEYGIRELGFSWRGLLTLVAFAWPLAFLIWSQRLEQTRFLWILYVAELFLCAGTVYWLGALTMGGRWLYGAYIVVGATAVYALSALVALVYCAQRLFLRRAVAAGVSVHLF
jgi:hypothetical protein